MVGLHTPLCDLLGIRVPILQAGMGRSFGSPTTPALAAAVSEAGGLGCIGGTGHDPDQLRAVIRETRTLTDRPFGVNLLLPASLADADVPRAEVRARLQQDFVEHWEFVQSLCKQFGLDPSVEGQREYALSPTLIKRQVDVVLEERVPVFAAGLGDPAWVVPHAHEAGITVIGLAGSPRNAARQRHAGVDAIIAQGHEAGGHTGRIGTLALVPQVVDEVSPTPVIAAGGIADGRGIAAALALGAQGVWCGTAFLFALETDLNSVHRRQLTDARTEDMVLGRSYTGKPSRVVRNEITEAWASSGLDPLPMPYQKVLMDDLIRAAELAGRYELVNNPGGQIVGILTEHLSATEIVTRLVEEATKTLDGLARVTGHS